MIQGSVARAGRAFRPRLEMLEDRFCPADLALTTPLTPLITAVGTPPSVQMTALAAGPHEFMLQGHVNDAQPAGLTVQIAGVAVGSVTTDALGNFQLLVEPSQLGAVQATVTDGAGLVSGPAYAFLYSAAPLLSNFCAVRSPDDLWTFTGQVTDEYAAGLTVQLGGLSCLQGITVTVAQDGTFSFTVELPEGFAGTATAQVTDWWGLTSNEAMYNVMPTV